MVRCSASGGHERATPSQTSSQREAIGGPALRPHTGFRRWNREMRNRPWRASPRNHLIVAGNHVSGWKSLRFAHAPVSPITTPRLPNPCGRAAGMNRFAASTFRQLFNFAASHVSSLIQEPHRHAAEEDALRQAGRRNGNGAGRACRLPRMASRNWKVVMSPAHFHERGTGADFVLRQRSSGHADVRRVDRASHARRG